MKVKRNLDDGTKLEASVVLRTADSSEHAGIPKGDQALKIVNTDTDHVLGYVVIDAKGYMAVYYTEREAIGKEALLADAVGDLMRINEEDLILETPRLTRAAQKLDKVGIQLSSKKKRKK